MDFNKSIQFNYIDKEGVDFEVLFKSEPMLIGKTYWIALVYKDLKFDFEGNIKDNERYGIPIQNGNYNTFCFYKEGNGFRSHWADMKNHPKYDFNDGTYAGLPKNLVKLYENNKNEIKNALLGNTVVATTLF